MSDNHGAARSRAAPHGMPSDAPPNPTATAPACADALLGLMRRGDFDAAGRLLDAPGDSLAPAQLHAMADGLMRRRRWAEAAWLFGRLPSGDGSSDLKRRLCGNLTALQAHRPGLYQQLIALPASDAFSVGASPSGRPTVLARRADGSVVSLAAGTDPHAAAAKLLEQLRAATPGGEPIGLCGLGDGYVLQALAQHPPKLFMDMEQGVFVLEPEPQVLLHALMIHDFAGPAGPIVAERFRWFVGPHWAAQLAAASVEQPSIGLPGVTLQQGMEGASVQRQMGPMFAGIAERDAAAKRAVDEYYGSLAPGDIAGQFGASPPRPPRVLLLTTRFSTVLQYSTRDTAEAFGRLGWERRVLIEPAPSHRIHRHAMRLAVAEFRPDLVFQIDHLRHEHGDLFPPQLPFACWAQDHLPNLTNPAAGASLKPRDFVLVGMPTMYVNRYGYPRRQTLMLAKLTRLPERPATWESDGDDLVYVSTASAQPADVAAAVVTQFAGGSAERQRFVEACCRRVTEHYAAGGMMPAMHDFRVLVAAVESEHGKVIEDEATTRRLADVLFDRLGNVLYRQQALAWVARVAERRGLTLAIYGAGWEAHPQFAAFARGPVKYGPQLEALTRRSKINFALEPFFSVSHQRLVDGLVAGGFFLVRRHPKNTLIQQVSNFLAQRVPASVTTAGEARALMSPADRLAFDALAERFAPLTEFADPVEFVRTSERARLVCPGEPEPLPDLGAISFADEAELDARVVRFVNDPGLRAGMASRQRETMETRRSYEAGVARIVGEIGALLAEELAPASDEVTSEPAVAAAA
jgi:hypothetical protein